VAGRPALPTRRDENRELTRRAVLDAASAHFAADGFAAASVGAIARSAG
jgi:AcrR family transcriptional regulator